MKTFIRNKDGPYGTEIFADEAELREVHDLSPDFQAIGVYGHWITEKDLSQRELAALNADGYSTADVEWFPRAVEKYYSVF